MHKQIRHILLLTTILLGFLPAKANDIINKYVAKIDAEKQRIDLLDLAEDNTVTLKSALQTEQATSTYLVLPGKITTTILASHLSTDAQKIDQLIRVYENLKRVRASNVHFYTQFRPIFRLIQKVQTVDDSARLESILRSNVQASLNLIAFYIDKPVAKKS